MFYPKEKKKKHIQLRERKGAGGQWEKVVGKGVQRSALTCRYLGVSTDGSHNIIFNNYLTPKNTPAMNEKILSLLQSSKLGRNT